MRIHNIIKQVHDGRPQQRSENIGGIVVHRTGINAKTGIAIGTNALDIASAFIGKRPEWKDVAKATGHQNAYTFYIGGEHEEPGKIWQAIPIGELGWHARRFSRAWLGIALIGDYRVEQLHPLTRDSLIELCKALCRAYQLDPRTQIKGHGEIPEAHGGDKAPGRPAACPGDNVDMDLIRHHVYAEMRQDDMFHLQRLGVVF